jgi:hypothetical protein
VRGQLAVLLEQPADVDRVLLGPLDRGVALQPRLVSQPVGLGDTRQQFRPLGLDRGEAFPRRGVSSTAPDRPRPA